MHALARNMVAKPKDNELLAQAGRGTEEGDAARGGVKYSDSSGVAFAGRTGGLMIWARKDV